MKHKDTCETLTDTEQYESDLSKFNAEDQAYISEWPDHCRECFGWGGQTYSYDPSPAGISLGPGCLYDYEPCEECVCKDKCPRCGKGPLMFIEETKGGLSNDHHKCGGCGWTESETEGRAMDPPDPPQCWCYEPGY